MAWPTASVSMITYNQADYIEQAIESVLAQRVDFPVELRIGDDCSTDGTRDVLLRYAERYPDRIVLNLLPSKGAGVPGRVNNVTTLGGCRGRYVAFLDGDDFWIDPDKLQRQVGILEADGTLAACAHHTFFLDPGGPEPGEDASRKVGPDRRLGFDDIVFHRPVHLSSFCLRRDAVLPLPPWFHETPNADVALMALAAAAGPVLFENRKSSVYRRHAGGSHSTLSKAEQERRSVGTREDIVRNIPGRSMRTGHAALAFRQARAAGMGGRRSAMLRHGLQAAILHPAYVLRFGTALARRLGYGRRR